MDVPEEELPAEYIAGLKKIEKLKRLEKRPYHSHFYIISHVDVLENHYAIGSELGPIEHSILNETRNYKVHFYRGVPSSYSRIENRILNRLLRNFEFKTHRDTKFYYKITLPELLTIVREEFAKSRYVCNCKNFCRGLPDEMR